MALACPVFAQTLNAPLQVGGDVKEPKLLKHPDAHAPVTRGWGVETGEAVIAIVIDAKGHIASAQISRSSGSAEFDHNALDAVRKYVFEPATLDGKPVAVQMPVTMNYRSYRMR